MEKTLPLSASVTPARRSRVMFEVFSDASPLMAAPSKGTSLAPVMSKVSDCVTDAPLASVTTRVKVSVALEDSALTAVALGW